MRRATNIALRDFMNREDGIAFFKTPLRGKQAGMLAAVLIQHPEHRFEIEQQWLGVFHA